MKTGRLARLLRLGGMATGVAGDVAGAAARRVTQTSQEAAARFHERAAQRLLRVFSEMKGLPLKAGQLLSYIDEFLPEEHRAVYEELLGKLQDHTPPVPWEEIEAVFQEAFDGAAPGDVFARFDPEPIAAASIGQVYAATLHGGGEDVVVKIQYPGIVEAFESDLANLDALVAVLERLVPGFDISLFVGDVMARILEECDYAHELDNQQRFHACWAGDPEIVVPAAFPALCRETVLVSERLSAWSWSEMRQQAPPALQSAYGRVIFRFVFGSLFQHHMFNGDPHPGNYLFYPDGRVGFLDYGSVQRYDADQAAAFAALRRAVLDGVTGEAFYARLQAAFGMPDDLEPTIRELTVEYMQLTFQPVTAPQPFRFTREYSAQLLRQGARLKAASNKLLLQGKNASPLDLSRADGSVAFLGRISFGLGSVLASLGAEGDFRAIIAAL